MVHSSQRGISVKCGRKKRGRVLVLNHRWGMCTNFGQSLKRQGYSVEIAWSIREALIVLETFDISCVLMGPMAFDEITDVFYLEHLAWRTDIGVVVVADLSWLTLAEFFQVIDVEVLFFPGDSHVMRAVAQAIALIEPIVEMTSSFSLASRRESVMSASALT